MKMGYYDDTPKILNVTVIYQKRKKPKKKNWVDKMPCTNQRTRPSVDFKEEFPKSVWGQGVQSDQDCSSFGCNRQIRKT